MTIVKILTLLYVTIGPTRATGVFIGLTGSADPALKRKIAIRTVLISTIVCCIFVLVGEAILDLLKVSIPALLIAGGGILFVFALNMVLGDDKQEGADGKAPKPSIDLAAYPLAVPLMASPQGLVAIVSISATMPDLHGRMKLFGLVLAVMAFNLFFMLVAEKVLAKIPVAVMNVFMRIIGVLLCSLAVQLILFGLQSLDVLPPGAPVN